jgi:chitin disaccharide deacetylase
MAPQPSEARKHLVVCADDFGVAEPVSDAILELIEAQRISATSVLVFGEDIARSAAALARARGSTCALGLHFTLTTACSGPRQMPLAALVALCGAHLIDRQWVGTEVQRQLDRFERLFGVAPDFLDGHQHVHQLPLIRAIVLDALCDRYGASVAIRSTQPAAPHGIKARLVAALGGSALAREARRRGLTVNTDFAGVYQFDRTGRYRVRATQWLARLGDGGLLMCHPGAVARPQPTRPDPTRPDPISAARNEEYDYLRSGEWPTDLAAWGVQLVPFRALTRSWRASSPGAAPALRSLESRTVR